MADLIGRVRAALSSHEPVAIHDPKAAAASVALILSRDTPVSILLIRRQERAGDPWSGHMALPGGFRSPSDPLPSSTAARETREETGLDLDVAGELLGALSDVAPQNPLLPRVVVRPFVFALDHAEAGSAGPEVDELLWIPASDLFDAANRRELTLQFPAGSRTFPSIQVGRSTIWGLTERILAEFAAVVGL